MRVWGGDGRPSKPSAYIQGHRSARRRSSAPRHASHDIATGIGATRERIDALTAVGHSLTELARVIGKPPTSVSRRSVTAQTAISVEALYESLGQPCLRRRPPDFPAQSSTFSNSRSSRGGSDLAWGEHLGQDSPGIDTPSIPIAPALAESLGVSQRTSQAFSKRDD